MDLWKLPLGNLIIKYMIYNKKKTKKRAKKIPTIFASIHGEF